MKKINPKSKVTKFYEDHKAACLIVAVIIGGAVGIAVEKKMECDRVQEIQEIQEMQEMYEVESHIYDTSTDMTMFHNDHGKPMGTVRDLPDNDSLTEAIRKESYVTDDTEIIGVKYYFRNN